AAIYCDNEGKNERALEAARHLADIGVEAVIGPGFSSHTLEVAPEVLIPNNMMAITPSATSTEITGLDDNNLIWRTVPSDRIQTKVLSQLVQGLKKRKEKSPPKFGGVSKGDTAKLGMSTRDGDAYSQGLRDGVVERLPSGLLEGDNFFSTTHPNPGTSQGQLDYSQIANKIATKNPDVMMVWGIDEVWPVMRAAHNFANDGPGTLQSTVYLTADGGKKLAGAQKTAEQTDGLGGRIWGTAPGTPNPESTESNAYKLFQFRWNNASFEGKDFGPAGQHAFISYAYDAVYLYGFASKAAGSFKAQELAAAIPKVTDPEGVKVQANQSEISTGLNALSKDGGTIELLGATGPIKFDKNGDPTTANIQLWCYRDEIYGVCQPSCTSDADCDSGEVCRGGACQPGCSGDEDCSGESAVCDGGVCRVSCVNDNPCEDDETCTDGACRSKGICQQDSDCGGEGAICDNGLCRTSCSSDVDCRDADVCQNGICRPRCQSPGSCAEGQKCRKVDLEQIVEAGNLREAGSGEFQFQRCDYPRSNGTQ
ncbi:MAG: ABC transporter substrate-binding protein, partial [Bradymonadaceae bacterium]